MRYIRPVRPFFQGARFHNTGEAPFEVEDSRAQDLVMQGLAEFVVVVDAPPIEEAVATAPAAAQKAVTRRQK